MIPDFPPWAIDAVRSGAWAVVPLLCVAVGWLVRELNKARGLAPGADGIKAAIREAINGDIRDLREDVQALTATVERARHENDLRHIDNVQRLARLEAGQRLQDERARR